MSDDDKRKGDPVDDIAAALDLFLHRWGSEIAEYSDKPIVPVDDLLDAIMSFDKWLYRQMEIGETPEHRATMGSIRARLIAKLRR